MSIGSTTFKIATLIEHAFRRCKVPVESQTPDTVQIAKNNLFFLITHLATHGLTLWTVDEQFAEIEEGKAKYVLPDGTIDLVLAFRRELTITDSTDTVAATSITSQFDSASTPTMIGITCDTATALTAVIEQSSDGATWTQIDSFTQTVSANETYWRNVDGGTSLEYVRIRETVLADGNFSTVQWVTSYRDVPLSPFSRQQYSQLPNRASTGIPNQFWFNRLKDPEIYVWPVLQSTSTTYLLGYSIQQQISDITSISTQLDVPNRWFDAIIWQLAERLCYELPSIDPTVMQLVSAKASQYLLEVEAEEVDGMPYYLQPDISVYNS